MFRSNNVPTGADWRFNPILRAVDFVESHIHDAIRVGDMAETAGYSIFHFCRCFNEITRHSPYDYQMKRKLTRALGTLASGDASILRVAIDYGFETSEGFSRAFRKMFGVLPSDVREGHVPDPRLSLPRLTEAYLIDSTRFFREPPTQADFPDVELSGVADRRHRIAESLKQLSFGDGYVVVDYTHRWDMSGPQVFMGSDRCLPQLDNPLRVRIGGGTSTFFALDFPRESSDSFLQFAFSVFCRRAGGPGRLPKRIIFTVTEGMVKGARM